MMERGSRSHGKSSGVARRLELWFPASWRSYWSPTHVSGGEGAGEPWVEKEVSWKEEAPP